jgi:multidrug resistance efflux pump
MQVAATAERQVRALMQQHEKLKADLESRTAAKDRKAQSRRVSELEQQLQDVRTHYQRKVKLLQAQLNSQATRSRSSSAGDTIKVHACTCAAMLSKLPFGSGVC